METPLSTAAVTSPAPVLVAVDARRAGIEPAPAVAAVERALRERYPPGSTVLPLGPRAGAGLGVATPARGVLAAAPGSLAAGGIPGPQSALRAVLEEGIDRSAAAIALVDAEAHPGSTAWLEPLLAPVLEAGFDLVCPAYRRRAWEALLTTGVVYPLLRALYGWQLRQPLGGELALSPGLARELLGDPDWRRDPAHAGSDAWVVAKVLAGRRRTCQVWLGAWPDLATDPGPASETLARVLGLVFREMERHAERWQRVEGSRPVPSFGESGLLDGPAPPIDVERLTESFRIAQHELAPVWGLVLPPATLLALQGAAAARPQELAIEDGTWARVVYDFAVAHLTRAMTPHQLLLAMTPLYLAWAASFLNATHDLDAAGSEERIEALCRAFEREKRYLIARWRWPDSFNP